MENVQKELIAISASLLSLTKQVEKVAEAIEGEREKSTPAQKTKKVKKVAAPVKKKGAPKKVVAKKAKADLKAKTSTSGANQTMLDSVLSIIGRSRNGIAVADLKKKTAFEARQVSNALYKLTKKGMIETVARGVYIKKKK